MLPTFGCCAVAKTFFTRPSSRKRGEGVSLVLDLGIDLVERGVLTGDDATVLPSKSATCP